MYLKFQLVGDIYFLIYSKQILRKKKCSDLIIVNTKQRVGAHHSNAHKRQCSPVDSLNLKTTVL